jgi:imidazolonepropionase-like amidohydrolase
MVSSPEHISWAVMSHADHGSGSDAAGPAIGTAWGLSIHQELALFVQRCGFTPAEALRSATSLTAKKFKFQDRGRISSGLKADLILVEGNPLDNIDHTLDLRAVWRDGVLCSAYEDKI